MLVVAESHDLLACEAWDCGFWLGVGPTTPNPASHIADHGRAKAYHLARRC